MGPIFLLFIGFVIVVLIFNIARRFGGGNTVNNNSPYSGSSVDNGNDFILHQNMMMQHQNGITDNDMLNNTDGCSCDDSSVDTDCCDSGNCDCSGGDAGGSCGCD